MQIKKIKKIKQDTRNAMPPLSLFKSSSGFYTTSEVLATVSHPFHFA